MSERRKPARVSCEVCGKSISRKADMARHLKTHAPNKRELMLPCPYQECNYKALQRSNLNTHITVIHYKEKPKKCPDCSFETGDPSSLTRHRERHHGYQPEGRSYGSEPRKPKWKRQQRRYNPYTQSPSQSNGSTSLFGEGSMSGSPLLANDLDEGNGAVVYSTGTTPNLTLVDGSHSAQNTSPYGTPPYLRLPSASETPAQDYSQLPEQSSLYATHAGLQPVCDMQVSEDMFNNFLAKFGESYSDNVPVSAPTFLPQPPVCSAPIPDLPTLPSLDDQYTIDNTFIPLPTSHSPNEMQYTFGSTPYEPYGYDVEPAPLHTSQLGSLATLDMGVYPQAGCHPDANSLCPTAYAGPMDYAAQDFYVN